jgi:hypothetical protein
VQAGIRGHKAKMDLDLSSRCQIRRAFAVLLSVR